MGDSGGTKAPGCGVVGVEGVVVAATPAGGVSPAEGVGDNGVGDNDVDGAAGVLGPTLGAMVGKVVGGAESLGLGAATGADERACANAASGSSSHRTMVARAVDLGVSITITMALPAVPGTKMSATAVRHTYPLRTSCEAGANA